MLVLNFLLILGILALLTINGLLLMVGLVGVFSKDSSGLALLILLGAVFMFTCLLQIAEWTVPWLKAHGFLGW